MATASSRRTEKATSTAASRWRQGTQHFLEKAKPVLDEIHETAKAMPHNGLDDAEKIVEMSVEKLKAFSRQYHEDESE